MKKLALTLIGFTLCAPALAENLLCSIKLNTEKVSEQRREVASGEAAAFGVVDGYRFKVTNQGGSKFEIEVFDPTIPARHYATGSLKDSTDVVQWSFWSQDVILDASCRLN